MKTKKQKAWEKYRAEMNDESVMVADGPPPPPKKTPFRIQHYSPKIQRKYKALIEAERALALDKTVRKKYRNSLRGKNESFGSIEVAKMRHYAPKINTWKIQANNAMARLEDTRRPGGVVRPLNSKNDWLGVEIECVVNMNKCVVDEAGFSSLGIMDKIGQFLRAQGCTYFDVKSDGSLRVLNQIDGGEKWQPVEITLLCRIGNFTALDKVCAALALLGAKVDRHCGLHVHIDARELLTGSDSTSHAAVEARAARLGNILPLMLAMNHPKRRTNTHCRPEVNGWSTSIRGNPRYSAVNVLAFDRHRTVEVRLHSGTTNVDKIKHWCLLLWSAWNCENWTPLMVHGPGNNGDVTGYDEDDNPIYEADVVVKSPDQILTEAKLNLQLSENTWAYIEHRVNLFAGDEESIKRKNKVGVAFNDEDTQEVIFESRVDHEFFDNMMTKVETLTDDVSLEDIQKISADISTDETFAKLNVINLPDYAAKLADKMSKKKNALKFSLRRDHLVFSKFQAQIAAAKTRKEVAEVLTAMQIANAKSGAKSGADSEYVTSTNYNVLRTLVEFKNYELRHEVVEAAVDPGFGFSQSYSVEVPTQGTTLTAEMMRRAFGTTPSLRGGVRDDYKMPERYRGMSLDLLRRYSRDNLFSNNGRDEINLAIENHPDNQVSYSGRRFHSQAVAPLRRDTNDSWAFAESVDENTNNVTANFEAV